MGKVAALGQIYRSIIVHIERKQKKRDDLLN